MAEFPQKNDDPGKIQKEASCGKGQSSQEASQQPSGPWAALLVARWLPQQPSRAAREFCWPASRQASGQHAHPMARQAGCQTQAGQTGSRLWKLASHRAILEDSIAKPARPRKKKRLRESPDPGKTYILAGVPVSHRSQLERRPALHQAVCQEAGNQTWANVWLKRLIRHQPSDRQASRQGPQAIARQPASHFHSFLDAKPRNNI